MRHARPWLWQLRPGNLLPIALRAALILFFALRAESFLSPAGILFLVALGVTLVILMGSIDLSVGSIILLMAAILSRVVNFGITAPILIILVVILVGALAPMGDIPLGHIRRSGPCRGSSR